MPLAPWLLVALGVACKRHLTPGRGTLMVKTGDGLHDDALLRNVP